MVDLFGVGVEVVLYRFRFFRFILSFIFRVYLSCCLWFLGFGRVEWELSCRLD